MPKRDRPRSSKAELGLTIAIQACLIGLLIGFWYYQTRPGRVLPIMLPPPEEVARALPELLKEPLFWQSLRITVIEMLGAFALAAVTGVIAGALLSLSSLASRIASPILVWCQTVPIILFYPLCLLFFGLGESSKIVFGGLYGFFPIAATTLMALTSVPQSYKTAAVAMGATRRQLITKVQVPAARPILASGLRIGAALCLIGVLAGEMLGAVGGLGFQINNAAGSFETVQMYAYIVMTLIVVMIFNLLINRADSPNE